MRVCAKALNGLNIEIDFIICKYEKYEENQICLLNKVLQSNKNWLFQKITVNYTRPWNSVKPLRNPKFIYICICFSYKSHCADLALKRLNKQFHVCKYLYV